MHTKDLQNVLCKSKGCGIMGLSGTIFDILSKFSIWDLFTFPFNRNVFCTFHINYENFVILPIKLDLQLETLK